MPAAPSPVRSFALATTLVLGGTCCAATAADNLILNGSFNAQPNPLAFWTNAPDALATWASDGANGSQGSVQLRFMPPNRAAKGAVYFTGLSQCVAIPNAGSYVLDGFARVPDTASPSSIAAVRWTLRTNGPSCTGTVTQGGNAGVPRSTTWTPAFQADIEIDPADWTVTTTVEIQLQVGDSSTASVEAIEAFVDEVSLVERPLFGDGFED